MGPLDEVWCPLYRYVAKNGNNNNSSLRQNTLILGLQSRNYTYFVINSRSCELYSDEVYMIQCVRCVHDESVGQVVKGYRISKLE